MDGPKNKQSRRHSDVAVAVALKRKREQLMQSSSSSSQQRQTTTTTTTTVTKKKKRNRVGSGGWCHDLWLGLLVYALCLFLPLVWSWFQRRLDFVVEKLGGRTSDARWTDLIVVLVMSFAFAALRIALVRWIVKDILSSPSQLKSLVQNRSSHLLSTAYTQTLTPTRERSFIIHNNNNNDNNNGSQAENNNNNNNNIRRQSFLHDIEDSDEEEDDFYIPDDDDDDDDDENQTNIEPSSKTMTLLHDVVKKLEYETTPSKSEASWVTSTLKSVRRSSKTALLGGATMVDRDEDGKKQHLSVAPQRFAAAMFRAVYCSIAIVCAYRWFGGSQFWPPALGGHGSTKHCWNLKGAVGMEEDFDQSNFYLKWYFWMQASYHFQSLVFHVWTMILWTRANKCFSLLIRRRSLLQHCVALLWIGSNYLFASTRRLGAIGNFCLDVSSFGLHLLQAALNRPKRERPLRWLHHLVVLVFVYTRFYVWPMVVWRSACVESHDWLHQTEKTLVPGVGQAVLLFFHLQTLALLGLNTILLKRLVRHPQVN